MSYDANTRAVALRLTTQAQLAAPIAVMQMAGGKNNRVFKLSLADGRNAVMKCYHVDGRDVRDRLGAEWTFLAAAWARGVRTISQPLACDRDAQAALYGFIAGRRLAATDVAAVHVQAVVAFVRAINAPPRPINDFNPGSEACFSFADHLATVNRRVARLAAIPPSAPFAAEAIDFTRRRLKPAWRAVRDRTIAAARRAAVDLDQRLTEDDVCLSPSDFGFHNAILDVGNTLHFIDFEYAGRDDPAKLICDFICQPEVPVSQDLQALFRDGVLAALGASEATRQRSEMLQDCYRVKWICIMLNDFLAVGAARRAFANADDRAERCAQQLAKARAELDKVCQ